MCLQAAALIHASYKMEGILRRYRRNNYGAQIGLIVQFFLLFVQDLQICLAANSPNQGSDTPVLRSCWELKLAGYSRSGEYTVDSDGPSRGKLPFTVYCDLTTGTSIVYHDRLNRGLVPRGFEERGNYRAPVSYFGANIEQLGALADVSAKCRQFVSFECHNVLMFNKEDAWTYWISRDGVEMENWGAPTGTKGCHCSVEQSCDLEQTKCSCDVNDKNWRKDGGWLTDKRTLPVKEMRFGDSQGGDEIALFRLGEFKCMGQDVPLPSSCAELVSDGYDKGVYLLNITSGSEEAGIQTPKVVECTEEVEKTDQRFPLSSCAELRKAGYRTDGLYEIDPDGPVTGILPFTVQCYLSSDITPPIMKSCTDLMLAGYSISKEYYIDPDGSNTGVAPFSVYCDLNTVTTIVHHDQPPLTIVPYGFEAEGAYPVPIHYMAEMDQMIALINSSKTCRQYISLDCHHVLIWHNTLLLNWWVSRDGEKMGNWGSPTGTLGCACSVTNSCENGRSRCNCDNNDLVWRRDDGYLVDKSKLPVIELRLTDTGHTIEQVFYTLGNLECSGFDENVKASSKADGMPLSTADKRPSKDISSEALNYNSSCSGKSKYTGLVVGIVLILIVVVVLLAILFIQWRSYILTPKIAYRSGVI